MSIATTAKQVYEEELRAQLERSNLGDFVAIEPVSRQHFVAKSFVDAALAAKQAFPDRKPFVLRIGSEAAFHIGAGLS